MRCYLPALLLLSSCSSLTGWLSEPVDDPTHTELPGGGSVVVTPPEQPGEATVDLPGGGQVTVSPAPAVPPKTRGDLLGQIIGGVAGAVSGNPLLGIGLAAGVAALAGRKKQ